MKEKLKMGFDMVLGIIRLMKQLTKENGKRGKNKEREKLFSKVAVFSKEISKMTSNMDMERCIIIPLAIISKGSGKMI